MTDIKKGVIKYGGVVASLLAVGALLLGVTHKFFIEFSGFAWFITYVGISFGLYSLVDNVFHRAFNDEEELKKGNVAYAIKMLGYAIIIAACVSAA